jgi:sporulation protein YlmC with PRC-barrel domain
MYSGNTKTTNELTASNKQIRQTTGEHLGQLKDLEISKLYKRLYSLERP